MGNSICRSSVKSATGEGLRPQHARRVLLPNPSYLRGGAGKLPEGIFLRALPDRTFLGDRADLDDRAVLKTRTLFGDLDRFVFVRDRKIKIAANRFLRFRETDRRRWCAPVCPKQPCLLLPMDGHRCIFPLPSTVRTRPSSPTPLFELCRRKPSVPDVAAKKQQVIRFCCRCTHNSSFPFSLRFNDPSITRRPRPKVGLPERLGPWRVEQGPGAAGISDTPREADGLQR